MQTSKMITSIACTMVICAAVAVQHARAQTAVNAEEARAIAKEAYIYANPLVDSYRILYGSFVDRTDPEYKGHWNQIRNFARLYTPDDRAVQTPNSDTPYSWLGMDLRTEPLVLTIPPIDEGRYFSVQLVDLYTHNFDYIGSRTTGNDGGHFLIAGPGWQGEAPAGITLSLQHDSPGKDKKANWLPAPEGPFSAVMRLYWPKPEALDATWTLPQLKRVQ